MINNLNNFNSVKLVTESEVSKALKGTNNHFTTNEILKAVNSHLNNNSNKFNFANLITESAVSKALRNSNVNIIKDSMKSIRDYSTQNNLVDDSVITIKDIEVSILELEKNNSYLRASLSLNKECVDELSNKEYTLYEVNFSNNINDYLEMKSEEASDFLRKFYLGCFKNGNNEMARVQLYCLSNTYLYSLCFIASQMSNNDRDTNLLILGSFYRFIQFIVNINSFMKI